MKFILDHTRKTIPEKVVISFFFTGWSEGTEQFKNWGIPLTILATPRTVAIASWRGRLYPTVGILLQ
jgi:hypothetical protein